jgi:hypothetical protein
MISSLQRFGACLNPCNCRSRERVDDVAPPGGRPRDGGLLCDGCRPWQRPGTMPQMNGLDRSSALILEAPTALRIGVWIRNQLESGSH